NGNRMCWTTCGVPATSSSMSSGSRSCRSKKFNALEIDLFRSRRENNFYNFKLLAERTKGCSPHATIANTFCGWLAQAVPWKCLDAFAKYLPAVIRKSSAGFGSFPSGLHESIERLQDSIQFSVHLGTATRRCHPLPPAALNYAAGSMIPPIVAGGFPIAGPSSGRENQGQAPSLAMRGLSG